MRKLTIDFETRSTVDLIKMGAYKYAEHETTDALVLALKKHKERPVFYVPDKFKFMVSDAPVFQSMVNIDYVYTALDWAESVEAHNSAFERLIWYYVFHKKYGLKPFPNYKLSCSAAKCAYHALPRALGDACDALGVPQRKDYVGRGVMMKMCKPVNLEKENKKAVKLFGENNGYKENEILWNEGKEDFAKLCAYCMQDTNAEESLSSVVEELPESERKIWKLDQRINDRGILIDIKSVTALVAKVKEAEDNLLGEIKLLTNGAIRSVKQVAKTLVWLETMTGEKFKNLQKETVINYMKSKNIKPEVKRLLEIRQDLGRSSVTKLPTMLKVVCKDNRARGVFVYHGAGTGRFSARLLQLHNLPRESFKPSEIEAITALSNDDINLLYGPSLAVISKCLRGMLVAAPGKVFTAMDYSAIESRVIGWLCNEFKILQAYKSKLDLYKINAADAYGVRYEDVTKEMRQVGKVITLALGYQGWVDAFNAMGKGYGVYLEKERAEEIIRKWRRANPNIVSFWRNIEQACYNAVANKRDKAVYNLGRISIFCENKFLKIKLPSQRCLHYYEPGLLWKETKFGELKESVTYMAQDITGKWTRCHGYGGLFTENIVQGVSRDLLSDAMLKLEMKNKKVVLHVHDEIVVEGEECLNDIKKVMSDLPKWAEGIPIDADGWVDTRYKKG